MANLGNYFYGLLASRGKNTIIQTSKIRLLLISSAALLTFFSQIHAQEKSSTRPSFVTITGTITDRESKKALPGATIISGDALGYADSDGFFSLRAPATYDKKLRIWKPLEFKVLAYGYYTAGGSIVIGETFKHNFSELKLALERLPRVDGISGTSRAERERASVSRQTLTQEELRLIPGSGGDIVRTIITTLPGVAVLSSFISSGYSVRGGDTSENFIYLDNLPVLQAFHFGGLYSIFHPRSIESIDLYSGAFPAGFGDALSSVLDIRTINRPPQKWEVFLDSNLFTANAFIRGYINDNIYFMGGARRSYYDLIAGQLVPGFDTFPYFWDYYAKITLRITQKNYLDISTIGSYDGFEAELSPGQIDSRQFSGAGEFFSRFFTQGLTWRFLASDNVRSFLTFGWLWFDTDSSFGQDPITQKPYTVKANNNWFVLRSRIEIGLFDNWETNFGTNLRFRYVPITLRLPFPATAEDPVERVVQVDDERSAFDTNLFANIIYNNKENGLKFVAGTEFNHLTATNYATLSPRLSGEWFFIPTTAISGGFGIYFQGPQNQQLTEDDTDLIHPWALHWVLGFSHQFTKRTSIKVEPYFKLYQNLIVFDRQEIVRDDLGNFKNFKTFYNNNGRGFATGAEVIFRKELSEGIFAWLTYSLSFARRSEKSEDPLTWFEFDQRHIAAAILAWKLNETITISAKWRLNSGPRATPYIGRQRVSTQIGPESRWVGKAGESFSNVIPLSHALDFRVEIKYTSFFMTYIELNNAYGQKNISRYNYNSTYSNYDSGLPVAAGFPGLFTVGIQLNF